MLIADSYSLMEEIFVAIVKDGKMCTMRSRFRHSQAIKKAVWTKYIDITWYGHAGMANLRKKRRHQDMDIASYINILSNFDISAYEDIYVLQLRKSMIIIFVTK